MREKISVIVPVYGVEKMLARCVESILAQTYENIELVLVDDGSPDQCPAICDQYAEKYKNRGDPQEKRWTDFSLESRRDCCYW